MNQKKLRLDDLQVETFEVAQEPRLRGTIRAHANTDYCTSQCSENGATCDFDCGASFEQQRECAGTLSCPGGCGGGPQTLFFC
jgi:hypothetical protein